MKKQMIALLLAGLMLLSAGCGAAGAKEVDAAECMAYIMENVAFADQLSEVDRDVIAWRYGVAEDVEAVAYVGSGATAEEACVFVCADEAAAKTVYDQVEFHLQDMIASFGSYLPAEVVKLENAVFLQQGNAVIFVVSADDAAGDKLDKYLK